MGFYQIKSLSVNNSIHSTKKFATNDVEPVLTSIIKIPPKSSILIATPKKKTKTNFNYSEILEENNDGNSKANSKVHSNEIKKD